MVRGIQYMFVPRTELEIYGKRTLRVATFRFGVLLFIAVFSVMLPCTFDTS